MPIKKAAAAATKAAEPAKKAAPRRRKKVTHEMIETRAYHLSLEQGGAPDDNWYAAERELLAQT
jgi:Protein of unknown function (DUF2934)